MTPPTTPVAVYGVALNDPGSYWPDARARQPCRSTLVFCHPASSGVPPRRQPRYPGERRGGRKRVTDHSSVFQKIGNCAGHCPTTWLDDLTAVFDLVVEVVVQPKFSALHNNGTMWTPGASHSVRLLSPNRGQPGRLALPRRRRGAFPMPGKLRAARAGAISL